MLISERSDYKTVIKQVKKMELAELDDGGSSSSNHSSIEHKDLLNNTKLLLENGYLIIIPLFTKIISASRIAVGNEYKLDKEATSYGDCSHALCLSLHHYEFADNSE
ncbi:MAG: hypothetical protein M3264_10290 [Thermoproteota archaeon]|nr:hypothetical protein [Thermoproteota archaeon]